MAASPNAADRGQPQTNDGWGSADGEQGFDSMMGPAGSTEPSNGAPLSPDGPEASQTPEIQEYHRGSSVGDNSNSNSCGKNDSGHREKQAKRAVCEILLWLVALGIVLSGALSYVLSVRRRSVSGKYAHLHGPLCLLRAGRLPNKVYVGGLPEHTRQEDLRSCFGKIGSIVNVELKVGYGFVEFDTKDAAEESVAKYNEGHFMGNKIRVEISHGGGRTSKHSGDPGACFKCGQTGHWARECPNHTVAPQRRPAHPNDASLIDRMHPPRDYLPPPRDYPPFRDDPSPGRFPSSRDVRYGYDYPPIPPPGRDYRRPPSPPRALREYPVCPPLVRSAHEYDDYRMRGPPPPLARYDRPSYYPSERDLGYPTRGVMPPPPRDYYDRYDRRPPVPDDKYSSYPPPGSKPRTPPGGPPPIRGRDDYGGPHRDHVPEGRGRHSPPLRYADYAPRSIGADIPHRRRSRSPPRSVGPAHYDDYSGSFPENGYSGPPSIGPSLRGTGGPRDYSSRNGRDLVDLSGGYNRRL
ncbi:hypothetical protein SERLA73DRAFT_70307 [Serpula lacrymans var. lacrymans S7.3]|uniref:CCHC-type domain-containing protein n=1 Tax=Serpula lacrymans var. lacrymans (strain S7.3) TaxID=936435 RepID=F8PMJ0_SERL3|nr:hypothetical protein SERLA73DRAFT_70307 [Serpula lacrymans var. lacrymans S7.3]